MAIVHLAIGYAFISGLAGDMMRQVPIVMKLIPITEAPPPPPNDPAPPPPRAMPREQVTTVEQAVTVAQPQTFPTIDLPPLPLVTLERTEVTPAAPLPPARPSQAVQAKAKGDRGAWITPEDYPARSLRNEEAGIVGISVRIGADGRVADCAVTATSGFPALDEATCRLYQRRARFVPARDAAGRPRCGRPADRNNDSGSHPLDDPALIYSKGTGGSGRSASGLSAARRFLR